MMKPVRSKPERLADVVDRGQRIADFLNDPVVVEFIDNLERNALQDLVGTAMTLTTSSYEVRAAAVQYNAIRSLRGTLKIAAADGARVLKNMSEI